MEFIHISKDGDERIVAAVVLQGTPPELEDNPHIDTQNEWYKMATVEEAAIKLMEKNERVCFDVQHAGGKCFFFDVMESFVAEEDMIKWDAPIKKGAWVMTVRVNDERVWKLIKEKSLNAFSIAGIAEA